SYSKVGNAKYAFYNPPWTLPFLRRNEVQFELTE
ncbi:MAG: heme-binding protein, partial [Rhodospirillaceae bacterium]